MENHQYMLIHNSRLQYDAAFIRDAVAYAQKHMPDDSWFIWDDEHRCTVWNGWKGEIDKV